MHIKLNFVAFRPKSILCYILYFTQYIFKGFGMFVVAKKTLNSY